LAALQTASSDAARIGGSIIENAKLSKLGALVVSSVAAERLALASENPRFADQRRDAVKPAAENDNAISMT